MFGYKDYYRSNIYFSGPSISFSASDFVPAEVIKVSGKIYDENGNLYKGGGTVSYSVYNGYNSYTVNSDTTAVFLLKSTRILLITLLLQRMNLNMILFLWAP